MLILYDIDNKRIKSKNVIVTKTNYYIVSRNWFKVTVLSGKCQIYFTIENESEIIAKKYENEKVNNITLMIEENLSDVVIRFENDTNSFDITFHSNFENQLTAATEHYNDLLINYYLPTIEELEPAILPGFDKREFIKRLLLDFRDILRYKGNVNAIRKFFYLIGFIHEQLQVVEEWQKPDKTRTTQPDRNKDIRTGDYQLIFKNWFDKNLWDQKLTEQYNINNTPYRPIYLGDFSDFCECIKYAIPLANKYFLAVEQEITKFAISFNSNIVRHFNMQMVSIKKVEQPENLRLKTHITITADSVSTYSTKLVVDNVQKRNYYTPYLNANTYKNDFNIKITAPKLYVTANIITNNSTINLFNNEYIVETKTIQKSLVFLNTIGLNVKNFRIEFTISDSIVNPKNTEKFSYEFNVIPNFSDMFMPEISNKLNQISQGKVDINGNPIINPYTGLDIQFYQYNLNFPNVLSNQSFKFKIIDKYLNIILYDEIITENVNKTILLSDDSIYNVIVEYINPISNIRNTLTYKNIKSTGKLNYEDNFDIRGN